MTVCSAFHRCNLLSLVFISHFLVHSAYFLFDHTELTKYILRLAVRQDISEILVIINHLSSIRIFVKGVGASVCASAEGETSVVVPEGLEQFASKLLLNDRHWCSL